MKFLHLLFVLIPTITFSQDYEICKWYNDKKAAIVLTFDDGTDDHPNMVVPILNRYNMKGTFYINDINDFSWAAPAIADGHEIGNHTKNHNHLLTLNSQQLKEQISDFNLTLSSTIGTQITTLAYPYGEGAEEASSSFHVQDSTANLHICGRGTFPPTKDKEFSYNFAVTDQEYYQLKTVRMYNLTTNFESTVNKCEELGGLMTYTYHGVGDPATFDNVDTAVFKTQLDFLQSKNNIWISTMQDAIKYHRERKGAVLTETSAPFASGSTWLLNLSDTIADSIYNHPLTIKLKIASTITVVDGVCQNNNPLNYSIENDSIIFNAVPDGGEIKIDVRNCTQPDNQITVSGATSFCLPDSVLLTAVHNPNYTYSWFKNDTLFGIDTNQVYVQESGRYHALVKLNNCPIETQKIDVFVTGTCGFPVADFNADQTVQYENEILVFSSTSTNLEGGELFYWDFGADADLPPGYYGAGPINVKYPNVGLKTVSLIVEGTLGNGNISKSDYILIEQYVACHAFKEDFNAFSSTSFVGGWSDYAFESKNQALRITTNNSGGNEWYVVQVLANDGMNPKPIDFSDPAIHPKLKFRIKASDTCRVSVNLSDAAGTVTSGFSLNNKNNFDVTTQYQEFEIDFTGSFTNEWQNIDLDSTKISKIDIAINPGFSSFPVTNQYGQAIDHHFVGTVDIDWISIGDDCDMEPLFASLSLPDSVCENQSIKLFNYSTEDWSGSSFDWQFGNNASINDGSFPSDSVISVSYSNAGKKFVSIVVTKADNSVLVVQESIVVESCSTDGIYPIDNNSLFIEGHLLNGIFIGNVTTNKSEVIDFTLLDLSGKVCFTTSLKVEKGRNAINLDLTSSAQGIYIVLANSKSSNSTSYKKIAKF